MKPLLALLIAVVLLLPAAPVSASPLPDGFADSAFAALWMRTDRAVATGAVQRSWTYGASPGEVRYDYFQGAPGDTRLVQYFDKARMEINDPNGNRRSPWFVTGGRLVVELITGRIQTGFESFEQRAPAAIPVAGDPVDNPQAPTYAQLAAYVSFDGGGRAPRRIGERVSTLLAPDGLAERQDLALPATTIVRYESVTGHNVPRVFRDFMAAAPVDALFAFGYPISEPYWALVRVGGNAMPVMFQAFERRVLTYNPANPPRWQVEMGNVGQHYVLWRYGRPLRYAAPPFSGVRIRETTLTIPTYDYHQALVSTNPGDSIYPYPRLDPARVGPPQPRAYRAIVVENRFLELTFLPELGGRLYRAVVKSTAQHGFYQNPVIKPAPFGQRGWWLGAGGLEWAAPTEEHGYLEAFPWDMAVERQTNAIIVRLTTTERQRGLDMTATVTLRADEGFFRTQLAARNPSANPQPLQMWMNAALASTANRVGPAARFVVPVDRMIVHATEDRGLPPPRATVGWPRHHQRDLSRPSTWNGYVGLFAAQPVRFAGFYDSQADTGMVALSDVGFAGTKVFAFSKNFDRRLFTDDGSDYAELWVGAQPTFWDDPLLNAGDQRAILASWMPLQGLGDLAAASESGAVGVQRRSDGMLIVSVVPARVQAAAPVRVLLDGREVFRSAPIALRPDLPLTIELPPGRADGTLHVETGAWTLETTLGS
ncbi:DUF5107 domain-containing protein [Roseiflexus sp.]|uniref:DUF5107 domain-containing protein n=1 Tax=Roseiflexus sp. TaxID=2562120 RepID=UPI0021DE8A78|nr:DUF5107 domain-containing protein [Roseiflexus sp.]GIV99634.1 MAG: hypothetical protein KatS3mg058_1038 [Roseiflexus sp.]